MIVGNGTSGTSGENQLLILGLSHINVARLLKGEPIHVRREIHGNGIPEGWEILIIAGTTEEEIHKELRDAGMIDDLTNVLRNPALGTSSDT